MYPGKAIYIYDKKTDSIDDRIFYFIFKGVYYTLMDIQRIILI